MLATTLLRQFELAAEGNVAAQVGHEIFGHDQDGAHR